MTGKKFKNVDEYIADFPIGTQKILNQLRAIIKKNAPNAEEVISYNMPAYKYNGMLCYFAGYKQHIGFYPTASGIANFKKEIAAYKNAKGSVQFPLNKPLPLELIKKIIVFRTKENFQKVESKKILKTIKKTPKTKTSKSTNTEQVEVYMKSLKHPMKKEVEALRQIILKAHKKIGEEIFWKAPTFFYTGEMKPFNPKEYKRLIVAFNLFKKDCIRLIFLNGAKVNDSSGLLEGDYKDGRRLAIFYNMKDIKDKEKKLVQILKKYLLLFK
jgi:uncharacterized protein YdhG (YjbR/CyaY superfamily)